MAIVFDCNWEDGSDILNTGGSYEWDSETDTEEQLSENSSCLMWGYDCLEWNGYSTAVGYLTKQLASSQGTTGVRFGFNIVSESLTSGQYQFIFRVKDTGGNILFDFIIYDTGVNLLVFFMVYDTGGTGRNTNGVVISTDTNYQVICKLQKNTAGGFYFTVYQEDGTTVVGSETQLSTDYTTRNSNAYTFYVGTVYAAWRLTNHILDIIQILNTYAYPDTVQGGIVYNETCTDGLSMGDSPASQAVLNGICTDGLSMGDTQTSNAIFQSLAADGISIGETLTRFATVYGALTDGFSFGEILSNYLTVVAKFRTQMNNDVDTFFNTNEHATTITYNSNSITAIIKYKENLGPNKNVSMKAKAEILIKVSDVATPAYRDSIVIGSDTWRLLRVLKGDGFIWTLELERDERPQLWR